MDYEHSHGGSMSTIIVVHLSCGEDADNASRVLKTRGRTDKELKWRNSHPLALLERIGRNVSAVSAK